MIIITISIVTRIMIQLTISLLYYLTERRGEQLASRVRPERRGDGRRGQRYIIINVLHKHIL